MQQQNKLMIAIFNPLKNINNKYIFSKSCISYFLVIAVFLLCYFLSYLMRILLLFPLSVPKFFFYLLNTTVEQLLTSAFSQLIGSSRHAYKLFFRAVA